MNLETLFLVVILCYLAMIAYGVVGSRRRGTPGRTRLIATALMVLIPPLSLAYAVYSTDNAGVVAAWGKVTMAMLVSGIATAAFTEYVAKRVGA